ncbi:hypothetical protein B0A49_04641 [Cryomyces minteri]|uniref:BHLH domain-containing protein n=1 Tax=Cryomyces minteri TaxID=331657 RepID=A0A4U0XBR8_9PEZI|nr:hypothetical protein B0A49_04641 [Cryomyces minteri]
MDSAWPLPAAEDLALGTQPANDTSYGSWEDWMRWDPLSDPVSPKQTSTLALGTSGEHDQPHYKVDNQGAFRMQTLPVIAECGHPLADINLSDNNTVPLMFGGDAGNPFIFNFEANNTYYADVEETRYGSMFDEVTASEQSLRASRGADLVLPSPPYDHRQQHLNLNLPPQLSQALFPVLALRPERGPVFHHHHLNESPDVLVDGIAADNQPAKKATTHNVIEKRYRNNLNDKIALLRDSVPSLRIMSKGSGSGEEKEEDDPEDLHGLTPAHKLNKATIMAKATEYIHHLEKRNKSLVDELASLKTRLSSLEKLVIAGSLSPRLHKDLSDRHPQPSDSFLDQSITPANPLPFSNMAAHCDPQQIPPTVSSEPRGLIQVPENIRRLRTAQHQQHNACSQSPYPGYPAQPSAAVQQQAGKPRGGYGYGNKLLIGSLAGLMVMEGYNEAERSGDDTSGRGLFSLPTFVLGRIGNWILPPNHAFGLSMNGFLPLLKILLVLGTIIHFVGPYVPLKPHGKPKAVPAIRLSVAPSPASPVEVRRKAWLTAIQTVWVPRHSFILEVAAIMLKMAKLSLRRLIGWDGYAILTGMTKEHEVARVKAWEIALDAQLAGGDVEISKGRLLLTLLASGTLEDTPSRLMLKALHLRVFFWEIANSWYSQWFMLDELTAKAASSYWQAARSEHQLLVNYKSTETPEPLPEHLAQLLDMEFDDDLHQVIVQRAYNLAWNKASAEDTDPDEGMDGVVEDFAVRSPLDAVAAWWSCWVLRKALMRYLDGEKAEGVEKDIDAAVRTAPPGSEAQTRAMVARAIICDDDREQNIATALDQFPHRSMTAARSLHPAFVDMTASTSIRAEVRIALTLAKCLALVSQSAASAEGRSKAFAVVLVTLSKDAVLLAGSKAGLGRMANCMRLWIGKDVGTLSGLEDGARAHVLETCLAVSKTAAGVLGVVDDGDDGYVSQSDDGERLH